MIIIKHGMLVAHGSYINIVKCRNFFAVDQHFFYLFHGFWRNDVQRNPGWETLIYVKDTFPARLNFMRLMPLLCARYQSFVLCKGTRMTLIDSFTGSCEPIYLRRKWRNHEYRKYRLTKNMDNVLPIGNILLSEIMAMDAPYENYKFVNKVLLAGLVKFELKQNVLRFILTKITA
jgi:hypothetical protein